MPTRHFRTRAGLVGVLAATTLVLPGAPAGAAGIRIPHHATLTIHGHGYGHGHGLSQYGAQGAAKKGLSAKQIVRFYYPHTSGGHVGGSVKVLITADTDDNTTVVDRAGLQVHDLGSGTTTGMAYGTASYNVPSVILNPRTIQIGANVRF